MLDYKAVSMIVWQSVTATITAPVKYVNDACCRSVSLIPVLFGQVISSLPILQVSMGIILFCDTAV